ncbi:hypothetical protein H671_2g7919 [Cricetulus griseus]|nr:hypothetical protein H671_2g7919 [Cricetulus griseus]
MARGPRAGKTCKVCTAMSVLRLVGVLRQPHEGQSGVERGNSPFNGGGNGSGHWGIKRTLENSAGHVGILFSIWHV